MGGKRRTSDRMGRLLGSHISLATIATSGHYSHKLLVKFMLPDETMYEEVFACRPSAVRMAWARDVLISIYQRYFC